MLITLSPCLIFDAVYARAWPPLPVADSPRLGWGHQAFSVRGGLPDKN